MADLPSTIAPAAIDKLCIRCKSTVVVTKAKYCNPCHRHNMRLWRITHKLSPEERTKGNCRSYANVYLKRGILTKKNCELCANTNSEMHHRDYSKPLLVTWLCRTCHLNLHEELRKGASVKHCT